MIKPQRIQLQRRKGWNLQVHSFLLNGLPAVNCARPGRYGNMHCVGPCPLCGVHHSREEAVDKFRAEVSGPICSERIRDALRGKNLACYCPLDQPCHCDVLLEEANR